MHHKDELAWRYVIRLMRLGVGDAAACEVPTARHMSSSCRLHDTILYSTPTCTTTHSIQGRHQPGVGTTHVCSNTSSSTDSAALIPIRDLRR